MITAPSSTPAALLAKPHPAAAATYTSITWQRGEASRWRGRRQQLGSRKRLLRRGPTIRQSLGAWLPTSLLLGGRPRSRLLLDSCLINVGSKEAEACVRPLSPRWLCCALVRLKQLQLRRRVPGGQQRQRKQLWNTST